MSRPKQADGRVHGVIVACRREDGRWLCIRRSDRVAAPLKVCFPGGAVEVGESQETALVREMREEIGVTVEPIRRVWHWDSPGDLTLWGWTATCPRGELRPQPFEVADVMWLLPNEIVDHPDAMPSNRDFVAALLSDRASLNA
jgi:8-oxo-dGTP pyrophosphatase MutT (NUDIX family)